MFCVSLYIKFYNQCKTFFKELYNISKRFVQNLKTQLYRLYRLYGVTILYELYNNLYNIVAVWFADAGDVWAVRPPPPLLTPRRRSPPPPLHPGAASPRCAS
jgi:hypothetical protein